MRTVLAPRLDQVLRFPIAGAARFELDEAHASIEFVGAKVTGRHTGKFGDFHGIIHFDLVGRSNR
ncbi:MAG TPA: hypothetical protein VJN18_34030 [Polyangiaceae bacterium]|nr:hypothetical protein [Polyangiaceae bacterium]